MTRLDRRALFTTGSAAALLAAAGVSSAATPQKGGTLRAALNCTDRCETAHARPGSRFLQAVRSAVFDTLTQLGSDGTLQPSLATAWEFHDDMWHFALRDDVLFHDGQVLTAKDIVASLQGQEVAAQMIDAHTVGVLGQDQNFPFQLASAKHQIKARRDIEDGSTSLTGTGLYRVTRFEPGRNFHAELVENHFTNGKLGWFDALDFVAIRDPQTALGAIHENVVDVADLIGITGETPSQGVKILRSDNQPWAALGKHICVPNRLTDKSFDNMQFMKRWWRSA